MCLRSIFFQLHKVTPWKQSATAFLTHWGPNMEEGAVKLDRGPVPAAPQPRVSATVWLPLQG